MKQTSQISKSSLSHPLTAESSKRPWTEGMITFTEEGAVVWLWAILEETSTFISNPTSENRSTFSALSPVEDWEGSDRRICFFYEWDSLSSLTSRVSFIPTPIFDRFTIGWWTSCDSDPFCDRAVLHMEQKGSLALFRYWPIRDSMTEWVHTGHLQESVECEIVPTDKSFELLSSKRCFSGSSLSWLSFIT